MARVLRKWADPRVRSEGARVNWGPVKQILQAARDQSQVFESRLQRLLDESDDALFPLRDPLRANVGLNRWLARDREEAYSDWLAWVLQEINRGGGDIIGLLQVRHPELSKYCKGLPLKVDREFVIPGGRLDIVVRFGEEVLLIIEIKTTSADIAEIAKQKLYRQWLDAQSIRFKPQPILLAVDAREVVYEGFAPLLWADVCTSLRRTLPTIRDRIGVVTAAMIVAFVSAVETNLLRLAQPAEQQAGRSLLYARTAEHVQRGLEIEQVE
jgi:hypothetical protein